MAGTARQGGRTSGSVRVVVERSGRHRRRRQRRTKARRQVRQVCLEAQWDAPFVLLLQAGRDGRRDAGELRSLKQPGHDPRALQEPRDGEGRQGAVRHHAQGAGQHHSNEGVLMNLFKGLQKTPANVKDWLAKIRQGDCPFCGHRDPDIRRLKEHVASCSARVYWTKRWEEKSGGPLGWKS